ncbi:hypothetical protein F4779DRAFT_579454 [Xylariaceae sp. FL0662B]|nr:hypothetical protein F4779DRAFT_579454 [Xylariaceae sp. FL0662B]
MAPTIRGIETTTNPGPQLSSKSGQVSETISEGTSFDTPARSPEDQAKPDNAGAIRNETTDPNAGPGEPQGNTPALDREENPESKGLSPAPQEPPRTPEQRRRHDSPEVKLETEDSGDESNIYVLPATQADGNIDTPSSRKRSRAGRIIKEESDDVYDSPAPAAHRCGSPETVDRSGEDSGSDPDSDADEIEISPFKRTKSEPGLEAGPASPPSPRRHPPPFYGLLVQCGIIRPLPPPHLRVHHADFPTRPALRCSKPYSRHTEIALAHSQTLRNPGRAYYRCAQCPDFGAFICWADARGVRPDNPRCDCGFPAREDITGDNSIQPNTPFYKCATDACRFRRFEWDEPLGPAQVDANYGSQV